MIHLIYIIGWVICKRYLNNLKNKIAQSAGAVEYTDCTSAEG